MLLSTRGKPQVYKIYRRPLPLEQGSPSHLLRAQKGKRLWHGDEEARKKGEEMLNRIGPKYGIQFSWNGTSSSAMDSLRLLLWAQSQGKNEELMAALGWRHHSEDQQLANHKVLLDSVAEAGLDKAEAKKVLESTRFQRELQECSSLWLRKTLAPAGYGVMVSGIPVKKAQRTLDQGSSFALRSNMVSTDSRRRFCVAPFHKATSTESFSGSRPQSDKAPQRSGRQASSQSFRDDFALAIGEMAARSRRRSLTEAKSETPSSDLKESLRNPERLRSCLEHGCLVTQAQAEHMMKRG
ncbi:unnamed protein product, partial [Symbiodinium sp. KB8]